MRVGFLTYGLDREPTGIGRYAVELLRALPGLTGGPEIVLLTTERTDQHGLWDIFERHPLPGCRLLPGLMTAGNLVLSWAVKHYRLDLIHDPNGIAPLLGPTTGARSVVTIHDVFAYACPETHNHLDNWRYHYMLPHALHRADAVLTDSQHSRHDITRYLGVPDERMEVISCGVDPRFRPIPDSEERRTILAQYGIKQPYILYVGGINARKNIAQLFEAFAQVLERRPDLTLVIAGKRQWQTGAIEATFQRLNLAEHVHFTGYLADGDLPALYSAAELFVFPSRYEGFGLPPLEAMACGTPVVTSNASSLPEVVGDSAITVDPDDVDALARAIEQIMNDSALALDLRAKGLARASNFTWERAATATIRVYEKLLCAA